MSASRRQILLSGGAGLVGLASGLARPGLSRAADRPLLTHGLQSGDVGIDSAVVWARSDRPARAVIEWATTESFSDIRGGVFADALPETD
ncbi:MAG: PhoD-like phosphatase N-terminal domain-containing protein, partial [Hyphomicrobiales bacterium]